MTTVAHNGPESQAQDVSVDDYVTGLLAGLAMKDVEAVSLRGTEFYAAMADAFDFASERAAREGLNLRFRIILDRIYQDSPVVRDAISGAVQRDLVSLDNPEYLDMRLKLSGEEAEMLVEDLPGQGVFFSAVCQRFLDNYPWVVYKRHSFSY